MSAVVLLLSCSGPLYLADSSISCNTKDKSFHLGFLFKTSETSVFSINSPQPPVDSMLQTQFLIQLEAESVKSRCLSPTNTSLRASLADSSYPDTSWSEYLLGVQKTHWAPPASASCKQVLFISQSFYCTVKVCRDLEGLSLHMWLDQ